MMCHNTGLRKCLIFCVICRSCVICEEGGTTSHMRQATNIYRCPVVYFLFKCTSWHITYCNCITVLYTVIFRGEDIKKREGVRKRPRSARRSKSRSSRGERDSRVTLSEGSYEEVKLTDSEYESGDEETFVEDRGCQTGWELFVQYDQVGM